MARPKKDPKKADPTPLDPLDGYAPCGTRGPITHLEKKPKMIGVIAKELAKGSSRKDAAAKAGTTDACLRQWLKRGDEQSLQGKETLYTKLLAEVNHAEAHFRSKLREVEFRLLTDPRKYDGKHIRWRMAVSDPKNYAQHHGPADDEAGGAGAFQLMTPEEAMRSVEEKIRRFLAEEDNRVALEAKASATAAPPPAADAAPAPDATEG